MIITDITPTQIKMTMPESDHDVAVLVDGIGAGMIHHFHADGGKLYGNVFVPRRERNEDNLPDLKVFWEPVRGQIQAQPGDTVRVESGGGKINSSLLMTYISYRHQNFRYTKGFQNHARTQIFENYFIDDTLVSKEHYLSLFPQID